MEKNTKYIQNPEELEIINKLKDKFTKKEIEFIKNIEIKYLVNKFKKNEEGLIPFKDWCPFNEHLIIDNSWLSIKEKINISFYFYNIGIYEMYWDFLTFPGNLLFEHFPNKNKLTPKEIKLIFTNYWEILLKYGNRNKTLKTYLSYEIFDNSDIIETEVLDCFFEYAPNEESKKILFNYPFNNI